MENYIINHHAYCICNTQVELAEEEGTPLEEEEEEPTIVLGTSTKQPTQQAKKHVSKRQKIEASENDLIKRAIQCLDQPTQSADGFELFGQYIATELRAILNPQAQRWAKLQIQNILFNAAQLESMPGTLSQDMSYPHHYQHLPAPSPPTSSRFWLDRPSSSHSVSPVSPYGSIHSDVS